VSINGGKARHKKVWGTPYWKRIPLTMWSESWGTAESLRVIWYSRRSLNKEKETSPAQVSGKKLGSIQPKRVKTLVGNFAGEIVGRVQNKLGVQAGRTVLHKSS